MSFRGMKILVVCTLAVFVLVIGSVLVIGHYRVERLEKKWSQSIFDGQEPFDRFPVRGANDLALEVEVLAGLAGIAFAGDDRPDLAGPPPDAKESWDGASEPLREWLLELQSAGRGGELRVPPEAVRYFEDHGPALEAVRDLLVAGIEPPRWELDLSQGWAMRIPNSHGTLLLQRALLARALERSHHGEQVEAETYLTAAWRLQEGIGGDPLLTQQLVSRLQLGFWLGVRRSLECPSASWNEPLGAKSLRAGALRALRLEAWLTLYSVGEEAPEWGLGGLERAPSFIRRLAVLHSAEAVERLASRLEAAHPSHVDAEAIAQEEGERIPRYAVVSKILYPSYGEVWSKAARTELEVDQVLRVSELRRQLAAGEEPPESVPSRAVAGLVWKQTRTAEGVQLELSGTPPATTAHSPLSLEYFVDTPSCAATDPAAQPG